MNAASVPAFYDEYPELAKIRDAMRTPFAAAFPNPVISPGSSTITLPVPRLETRRASSSPFEQAMEGRPIFFHSWPAVVSHYDPAPASVAPDHGIVPMPQFHGFHPVDLSHPASLPVTSEEPAPKRRRIGEAEEWISSSSSQPLASTVPSLISQPRLMCELPAYAKLMGLAGEEGEGFVRKIFNKYNVFPSVQERVDFAKKMFFHLSIAVTSVEPGETQMTEVQMRKLSIAVLNFAKTMHRHMGTTDPGFAQLIREVILDTFNQHPSITKAAKEELSFNTSKDYHFVSGKNKFTFMCWCADQCICLDQREMQVLKAWRSYSPHVNCPRMLEEIRKVARTQARAADS